MTKMHDDRQSDFVSFIRQNQPIPPSAQANLEQKIIDSLEPRKTQVYKRYFGFTGTVTKAIARSRPTKLIATGFLFTSVSFGLRTPRIATEPKDLENFLVKNWQDTLNKGNYSAMEEAEAYWLLPTVVESKPALSVSAQ